MSQIAAASLRHFEPVPPGRAEGPLAEVYEQVESDLGIVGPALTMLSPAPELLAGVWSLLRESLLVGGREERRAKEIVALAVSVKNSCRFCIEAHTMMLHALGDHETAEALREGRTPIYGDLVEWAAAPKTDGPFEAEAAPRFIGTALVFEVITRLLKALATNGSPHAVTTTRLGRSVASRRFRSIVEADLEPGASLPLLQERPAWLGEVWPGLDLTEPEWADGGPVGTAFAHMRAIASLGRDLLHENAAEAVERAVDRAVAARGTALAPGAGDPDDVEGLPERAALGARLAARAALDPAAITDADIAQWRNGSLSDHSVVFVLAFAVARAVDRFQSNVTAIDHSVRGTADA